IELTAKNPASKTPTNNRGVHRRGNRIETSGHRLREISRVILLQPPGVMLASGICYRGWGANAGSRPDSKKCKMIELDGGLLPSRMLCDVDTAPDVPADFPAS